MLVLPITSILSIIYYLLSIIYSLLSLQIFISLNPNVFLSNNSIKIKI